MLAHMRVRCVAALVLDGVHRPLVCLTVRIGRIVCGSGQERDAVSAETCYRHRGRSHFVCRWGMW